MEHLKHGQTLFQVQIRLYEVNPSLSKLYFHYLQLKPRWRHGFVGEPKPSHIPKLSHRYVTLYKLH